MPSYTLHSVTPTDLREGPEGCEPYRFSYGQSVDIGKETSFLEYANKSAQQGAAVQWVTNAVVMNGTQRWLPGTRTIDGKTICVHFLELATTNWVKSDQFVQQPQFVQQATCMVLIREP